MKSVEAAYKAYPLTNENKYNHEINAKRVGFQQGYEQAEKDNRIEFKQYDKDMLNAIEYCVKNGKPIQECHLNWIKRFVCCFY